MLVRMLRDLLAFVLLLPFGPAVAETLDGQVVEISDGATLTVQDSARVRLKIRLAGIDAPESAQPFGRESRKHLSDLTLGRTVRVEWRRQDDYGRILGKVVLRAADCPRCPKTGDAGLAQLEAGLAWWRRDTRREQTLEDQGYYEYAEFDAKARRIGLWQDPAPVPPWEWRKRNQIIALRSALKRPGAEARTMTSALLRES